MTWLRSALPAMQQALRKSLGACAGEVSHAHRLAGDVEGWLNAIGSSGNANEEAETLRL